VTSINNSPQFSRLKILVFNYLADSILEKIQIQLQGYKENQSSVLSHQQHHSTSWVVCRVVHPSLLRMSRQRCVRGFELIITINKTPYKFEAMLETMMVISELIEESQVYLTERRLSIIVSVGCI